MKRCRVPALVALYIVVAVAALAAIGCDKKNCRAAEVVFFSADDSPLPALDASLTPTTDPTATPDPTPTATPVPTPTPIPTPFSIVWFPDTQTSSYRQPEALTSMGTWVHDHIDEENIVQVVQTGDLVEGCVRQREWDAFYSAYDQFIDRVPYIAIAGNHDLGIKLRSYEMYLSQRFLDELPEEQKYLDGKAVYTLLNAGGVDFIIIGSGYSAAEECAPWVNEKLRAYQDRVAILIFHDYLHPTRGLYESGPFLFENVVKPNPNVRLVLCGHFRKSCYRFDEFDDNGDGVMDRGVNTMMFNYQGYAKGGQMRLLHFDPLTREITVSSFSSFVDRHYPDNTLHKDPFVLADAF